MEERHSEDGRSPFVAQDSSQPGSIATTEERDGYIQCPQCEEFVTTAEFDDHTDLHGVENDSEVDEPLPDANLKHHYSAQDCENRTNGYNSPYGNSSKGILGPTHKYAQKSADPSLADSRNRQSGATDHWKKLFSLPSVSRRHDSHVTAADDNEQRPRKRLGVSSTSPVRNSEVVS